MWNEPTPEQLASIPSLYCTEKIPFEDKVICLHFFIPGNDSALDDVLQSIPSTQTRYRHVFLSNSFHWYIAEYDGKDLFNGFAHLGDPQCAEWGYISFGELREPGAHGIHVIHDVLWKPKRFAEIMRAQEFFE